MMYQELKNRMKELKIQNKDMAERIDRSPAALSKYLSGRDELDFYNIKLLVKELYKDHNESDEAMKNVALSVERPDNIKCAIEYASFREHVEILEGLISKAEQHTNRELNEWARVYEIHLKFLKKEINALELVKMAGQLSMRSEDNGELLFFRKWMIANGNYFSKNFSILPLFLNELEYMLKDIHNEFIKRNYSTKIYLLCGNFNLFNNTLEEAKYYYNKVIEYSMSFQKKGHAYHGLGLCFMLEDKKLSFDYFKKAIQIFEYIQNERFINNAKHAFNIASNYNDSDEFYYIDCPDMKLEVAHRYIRNGEKEKATEILELTDFDALNIQDKGFYNLYKGLLYNDIDSLYMSVMYFKKSGSKFYALLSCRELIKQGERTTAIFAAYGEIITLA